LIQVPWLSDPASRPLFTDPTKELDRRLPLPHVPDEPTDRDMAIILHRLERGIAYFETGPPTPVDKPFPNGTSHKLVPVVGIVWASGDPNVAVVYLEDKPYAFSYDWIGGKECWLNRKSK
jgi:hypothetical protein